MADGREGRWKFDRFQPVAMTGGSGNHARIIRNISVALYQRLASSPYEVLGSEAGIETANKGVRYQDGVVTCTPFDGRDRLIPRPVIVFEVTSPSSTREDRIVKPRDYATVLSIRRFVLVEQGFAGLTVLSREANEPSRLETLKSGDTLAIPAIGVALPVDELYVRVAVDEPQDGAQPSG